MPCTSDIIYIYDASFEGFLTCVYECVYNHELPLDIICVDDAEPSMFLQRNIETNIEKAAKVHASIPAKMGKDASALINAVFLSCAPNKEMTILHFMLLGYKRGTQVMYMLSHPYVAPMYDAEKSLKNEAHNLLGFVRFSDYGNVLAAVIHPKNFVLPFIQIHFIKRFICEDFIIYDKTHKAALVYYKGHGDIISLDALELPPVTEDEERFRTMWKTFYSTIAIKARTNPRCRMAHCPKRYWADMLEVRPELNNSLENLSDTYNKSMPYLTDSNKLIKERNVDLTSAYKSLA